MWREEDFYSTEFFKRMKDGSIQLTNKDPHTKEPQTELATEYHDQQIRRLTNG